MNQNASKQTNILAALGISILIIIPIAIYIGQLLLGIISVALLLWLVAIIDCLQRSENKFPRNENNEKLIWILVLVLLNIVGAILYFGFILIKDNGKNIGISEN